MRTTDITIDGYTYRSASVEVETFTCNKEEYNRSRTVNADIVVTEPTTKRDTMVAISLQVESITIEAIESKALEVLTA